MTLKASTSIFGPYSSDAVSTTWSGSNLRIVISSFLISNNSDKTQLKLMGYAGYTWSFTDCFIGYQASSGDPYDFDGTPVRVTFGGANNVSVDANGVFSDSIDFSIDLSKNLVISFYFNDSSYDDIPQLVNVTISGVQCYSYFGANEAGNVDASSGYTIQPIGRLFCVAEIFDYGPLFMYYTMDTISGSTLYDETNHNVDITLQGTTFPSQVTGKIGQALEFDNDEWGYADPSEKLTNDMAISVWVKFTSLGTSSSYPILFGLADGANNTGIALLRTYGGKRIHLARSGPYSNKGFDVHQYNNESEGFTPSLNTWYHFVYQYRTSDDRIQLWVNGNLHIDTTYSQYGSSDGSGHYATLRYYGADGQMDCVIDQLKIFDFRYRSWLTPDEIYELYTEEPLFHWAYKKKLTISGSTGAGSNYQVLLKVGESATASGCDFHVQGCSYNFPSSTNQSGDLRFVDNDDVSILPFWVEKVEGTSPSRTAYCWVKIKDNLDVDTIIYCYYGNSSAENVSNGKNTFIIFDDFDDDSMDTAWSTVDVDNTAGTSFTETAEQMQIKAGGSDTWTSSDQYGAVYQSVTGDFVATVKVIEQQNTNNWAKAGLAVRNDMTGAGSSLGYAFLAITPGNGWNLQTDSDGNGYLDSNIQSGSSSYPAYLRLIKEGTNFSGYYSTDGENWSLIGSVTLSSAYSTQDIGMSVTSHNASTLSLVKFDNFIVRKYTYPEPSFVSAVNAIVFSSPYPYQTTVYDKIQSLKIIPNTNGELSSYEVNFYNKNGNQLISTVSGSDNVEVTTSGITWSGGENVWYVSVPGMGTSEDYYFWVKFICSGTVEVDGVTTSGILIRLYNRETGNLVGSTVSSGNGKFSVTSASDGAHFIVAYYGDDSRNALIYDWVIPE